MLNQTWNDNLARWKREKLQVCLGQGKEKLVLLKLTLSSEIHASDFTEWVLGKEPSLPWNHLLSHRNLAESLSGLSPFTLQKGQRSSVCPLPL